MAIVKIKFVNNAALLERYIFSHRSEDDPVSLENCIEGDVAESFLYEQKVSASRSTNQAIHIIQSWDAEESKSRSPEELNELGKELVSKAFPGYSYAIVTHAETDHVHNHIMLSPVHNESGVRIKNKKHHWYDLKDINDEICLEKGLKIVERGSKRSWDKKPDKAKEIEKRGGFSFVADLKEKAKFAASISTSFDEYAGVLREFGIDLKIRGETISYRYQNKTRFKRADRFGDRYDFKALVSTFELNDKTFIDSGIKLFAYRNKDHSFYNKMAREDKYFRVPDSRLNNLVIPIDTIRSISESSIESYCKKYGIELTSEVDGSQRLKGREYIRIECKSWYNEKNKTSGNQLDFIVNSEGLSYLDAVSKVVDDPEFRKRLANLESIKPSYRSFYVPIKRNQIEDSAKLLSSFVKANRFNPLTVKILTDRGQLRIYSNDRFKFYPANTRAKSISYYKSGSNSWFTRKVTGLNSDLLAPKTGVKKLILMASPIDLLLSKNSNKFLSNTPSEYQIASPLEPLKSWVKKWENSISKLDELLVVGSTNADEIQDDLKVKTVKSITIEEFDKLISKSINKQFQR